jgi:hypothetical protein
LSVSISLSTSTSPLTSALTAQGLSSRKAALVESDLQASVQAVSGSGGAKPATAEVRAALNERMDADVAAGKLSREDADAVNETLDAMDEAAGGEAGDPAAAASGDGTAKANGAAKGGAPAGGGGGGSSEKTELYRTEVDSGTVKTITITYTDGTTETEEKPSTLGKAAASATPETQAYEDASREAPAAGSLFDRSV